MSLHISIGGFQELADAESCESRTALKETEMAQPVDGSDMVSIGCSNYRRLLRIGIHFVGAACLLER